MSDFSVVIGPSGAVPKTSSELRELVVSGATSLSPGITTELPGSLVEDMVSTSVGAIMVCDQTMVDLINSVTPYAANIPMLNHLGEIYGIPRSESVNTAVYVVFSGVPGYVVPRGLIVSDGDYQYSVQNNCLITESGKTSPVYCIATSEGNWPVPAGTVNQIVTSVPSAMRLSVTNPGTGIPGREASGEQEYRARVMEAGMFAVQGTPSALKVALCKVSGVQPRLVSYRQIREKEWAVVVGGGDSCEVAHAVYSVIPDVSRLTVDVTETGDNEPERETVTIMDFPDSFQIGFLRPYQQIVTIIVVWDSVDGIYVDPAGVSILAVPTVIDYINNITVGMPVNIFYLQTIFQNAIKTVVDAEQLSLIRINIAVDGVVVPPDENTGLIHGGRYGYFFTDISNVVVKRYDGTC